MITLSLISIFFGAVTIFYCSEKSAEYRTNKFTQWINRHKKNTRQGGWFIIAMGLLPAFTVFGKTSGFLFWCAAVMLIISLVLLIFPLQKIPFWSYLICFGVFFTIEFFQYAC